MKYVKEELELHLQSGKSLKQLGALYGVSKQRMYQVLAMYGISTPEQTRKGDFKLWSEKEKWAWKIISNRLLDKTKQERLDFLNQLELPDICPVLGIQLNYSFGKGMRTENSPSIDKKIPEKGYTNDNCIIISWRANRIKNDGTPEEHRKIADFYTT